MLFLILRLFAVILNKERQKLNIENGRIVILSNKNSNIFSLIMAFVFLAVIVGVIYSLGHQLIVILADPNSKVGAPLIVTAGTILVSVLSVTLSRYLEGRAVIQKEQREKKIPVYEDLLAFMFKVFMGTKTKNPVSEEEIIDFMSNFTQVAMVWASDDVLNAWIKFRRKSINSEEQETNPFQLMLIFEDLIREIRRDLGHRNKNLTNGKLLSLFVNDLEKYINEDGELAIPDEGSGQNK